MASVSNPASTASGLTPPSSILETASLAQSTSPEESVITSLLTIPSLNLTPASTITVTAESSETVSQSDTPAVPTSATLNAVDVFASALSSVGPPTTVNGGDNGSDLEATTSSIHVITISVTPRPRPPPPPPLPIIIAVGIRGNMTRDGFVEPPWRWQIFGKQAQFLGVTVEDSMHNVDYCSWTNRIFDDKREWTKEDPSQTFPISLGPFDIMERKNCTMKFKNRDDFGTLTCEEPEDRPPDQKSSTCVRLDKRWHHECEHGISPFAIIPFVDIDTICEIAP